MARRCDIGWSVMLCLMLHVVTYVTFDSGRHRLYTSTSRLAILPVLEIIEVGEPYPTMEFSR